MDEELPAVLLMGGGEGMGPVETTARALGDALYDSKTGKAIGQLVVVCGRNKRLEKKLRQVDWKVPVQVLCLFLFKLIAAYIEALLEYFCVRVVRVSRCCKVTSCSCDPEVVLLTMNI